MIKRFFILFSSILVITLLLTDCKNDPPVVPPIEPPPTHPTITWVADTIKNPYQGAQLLLRSLWGSDTNDVYAIGHNAWGGNASMYHFDGQQWSVIKVTQGEGGFIGSYVSFSKIDGSGKNDVWAVGSRGGYFGSLKDSSLVIHYDGSIWKEELLVNRCKDDLQGLKVFGPNDVYMSGSYGEIYHYDGNEFHKTIVDSNLALRIAGDRQRLFVGGRTFSHSPSEYISVYSKMNNEPWTLVAKASEIDYAQSKRFGYYDFYPAGGGKYFVGGEGIYTIQDTTWQLAYNKESLPFILLRGSSSNNVFALSQFRKILHWNGADWEQVNMPDGVTEAMLPLGIWVYDKSVFISVYYRTDINIIYRGSYQ
jgi:hypothetical protein